MEQLIADAQKRDLIRADDRLAQLSFELTSHLLMANTAFVMHNDPCVESPETA